jgi:SET domain-containing protein
MNLLVPTKIEIKNTPGKGFGVFATDVIEIGEVIEECHLVTLPIKQGDISDLLADYRFAYPLGSEYWEHVVVLGYGSIYNHSNSNNAAWRNHPILRAFQFYAVKQIQPGEEICTYYGGDSYWKERSSVTII